MIVAGWSIRVHIADSSSTIPENRIMLPDKYVNKVANQLDAPLTGARLLRDRARCSKRSHGDHPTISGKLKLQSIAAIPRGRCYRNGEKICCVELLGRVYAPFAS